MRMVWLQSYTTLNPQEGAFMAREIKVDEIKVSVPLDSMTIHQYLCKVTGKFGLYVGFDTEDFFKEFVENNKPDEISKATNGRLTFLNASDCIREGEALFLFDTEEELYDAYVDIVGKDGPTKKNSYNGNLLVYAMTISNEGEIWTENC